MYVIWTVISARWRSREKKEKRFEVRDCWRKFMKPWKVSSPRANVYSGPMR
jgi:hypothetical protein